MRAEHELRAESPQTERADFADSVSSVQHCDGAGDTAPRAPERAMHKSGYRFGPGNFTGALSHGEGTPNAVVPGVPFATTGYELLAYDGTFTSWHECVLDAFDALKAFAGAGKVVRCSDRALLRIRHPRRRRTT